MIIEHTNSPEDIKELSYEQLEILAEELRDEVLNTVSKSGGHLASNLCVAELTLALHRVFDSPEDKIIWDVGHQSYIHKMITGRKHLLNTLRRYNGISGFTCRAESPHDPFGAGHGSTALSAALGIAAANKLKDNPNYTIAVIGDGAFTGGMVYEALNNCGDYDRLIIVLNDNDMSISKNVGGISRYFRRFRNSARYFRFKHSISKMFGSIPLIGKGLIKISKKAKNRVKRILVKENFFEVMGLNYFGPIDGNNQKQLEILLNEAKLSDKCSVVHICTTKGKGYKPAEEKAEKFHSIGSFDIETGKPSQGARPTFSSHFGNLMTEYAKVDKSICGITAAMTDGTGLGAFAAEHPDRFFDVGIAEGHATTFCAGLATQGNKAVFAVYSTFFQRGYDQFLHDVAIQKLPVILALDRAGFVGEDGVTHHGIFDVSLLNTIPGTVIYSPESFEDFDFAFERAMTSNKPVAIRYPKGSPEEYDRSIFNMAGDTGVCEFGPNPTVSIISYGRITKNALLAAGMLYQKGINCRVIKLICIKPLDFEKISLFLGQTSLVYILEEGMKRGGIGETLASTLCPSDPGRKYAVRAIEDNFVLHGSNDELFAQCGFSPNQITREILSLLNKDSENQDS